MTRQIDSFSINVPLAQKIVDMDNSRRSLQISKCFFEILSSLPNDTIIKDIDVLFNPIYKIDVMTVLTSTYKYHHFSLIWPGEYADGKLVYSEKGYPDYKEFEVRKYDIILVI
nr:BREX-3 system P-loop-containing protein BrxF [Clostridia bacterium]